MSTFDIVKEFPELKDRYRRISLYSDFSNQRLLNPINYEANVGFWRRAIANLLAKPVGWNGEVSPAAFGWYLRSDWVAEALAYQEVGGRQAPLSLDTVLDELVESGELIPKRTYLSTCRALTEETWGAWLWRQVAELLLPAPPRPYREFVVKSKLDEVVDRLLKHAGQSWEYAVTDTLFDLPGLVSQICRPGIPSIEWDLIPDDAINLLLAGLNRRGCAIRKAGGMVCIKLPRPGSTSKANRFTDLDLNILSIKRAHGRLKLQICSLEKQAAEMTAKVKEQVHAGNKAQALRHLKQRKQVEALLDKRLAAADNLSAVLGQLQQTELDQVVVEAYQEGTKGLRELLAKVGVDKVETAMDQIQEALADYADVQNAIATPLTTTDHLALEAELNSLLEAGSPDLNDDLIAELDALKISNQLPTPKSAIPYNPV
ncbi:hypothetical protein L0F63_007009 [Massospora cicadina]|nr:hypothetical protein L0F63_007009 [Massospora cicadina]